MIEFWALASPKFQPSTRPANSDHALRPRDSQYMHNIWHSACLRALERSLSRGPAVRPLRRVFSSSPPWSALPKKDLAMEDYPCDVIRYCVQPFHGITADNLAETSLSSHILVRNQRREFGRTTDSDPNRPWQVDAGG